MKGCDAMTKYDAVIIGAGNGGLTAAATMARNGLKVIVLEKHNIPGGCATSFRRGPYEFEVSLHQLSGFGSAAKPGMTRQFLEKLGVVDRLEWIEMENLYRVVVPKEGFDVTLSSDREVLVERLQKEFPEEGQAIADFFSLIYCWFKEMVGVMQSKGAATKEQYPVYFKYALKTAGEVLDEFFKDPKLKLVLSVYWTYAGIRTQSWGFASYAGMMYQYLHDKPYHIVGGSQALSNSLASIVLENGGEIRYNCEVTKICVEDERITGVITEDNEKIEAYYVVSNASSIDTYIELIDKGKVPKKHLQVLGQSTIGTSIFVVYCGLDCEPHEIGIREATNFICETAEEEQYKYAKVLDIKNDTLLLTNYDAMGKSFTSPGISQAAICAVKYAEPWLSVSPEEYNSVKYRCAEDILQRIEEVFPGFRAHIEEIEVATPLTFMRYIGTPGGAIYGFDQYNKDSNYFISPKSPIEGLYTVGAWAGDGGYQPTLISGGSAANAIIKEINKKRGEHNGNSGL